MERVAAGALAEARAGGLEVRAEANRLVIRGPRSQQDLARRLLDRKGEVLALLAAEDAEVAWRAAAMRPQVPARGPIPVLVARDLRTGPDGCISCGNPLAGGPSVRCAPCARASWLVLHELREGVSP